MFRAYLGPSSGGTSICIQQLVLIIPFRLLLSWLDSGQPCAHQQDALLSLCDTVICHSVYVASGLLVE